MLLAASPVVEEAASPVVEEAASPAAEEVASPAAEVVAAEVEAPASQRQASACTLPWKYQR
jgi:hypothetical protein